MDCDVAKRDRSLYILFGKMVSTRVPTTDRRYMRNVGKFRARLTVVGDDFESELIAEEWARK